MMFAPVLLITCTFLIPTTQSQFLFNYEEPEANDSQDSDISDSSSYQYNSPSTTNQKYQRVIPDDRRGTRRTQIRSSTRPLPTEAPVAEPPLDQTEDVQTHRPRRRKIRRRQRIQTSGEIPAERPYAASIFENIRLGEPPVGVYIPEDSLLNVLRNPSERQRFSNTFMNTQAQNSFFMEPQPVYEMPNVVYARDYLRNEDTTSPITPTIRQRTKRPRTQSSSEPEVDLDVYRSYPDDIQRYTAPSQAYNTGAQQYFQANPIMINVTQAENNQVQVQSYTDHRQPARTYGSSIFQNMELGEAPNGVYIPEDSFLNVLRNPSRTGTAQSNTRNVYDQNSPTVGDFSDSYSRDMVSREHGGHDESPVDSERQYLRRTRVSNRVSRRQSSFKRRIGDTEPETSKPEDFNSDKKETDSHRNHSNRRAPERSNSAKHSRGALVKNTDNAKATKLSVATLPEDTDDDGIPGAAGSDYPTLHVIPKTDFSCAKQSHSGYYADLETSCQVVHLCQSGGVRNSFLCPNGTIFSQEKFSCQWWYKVNCADSPRFYSNNDALYKVPSKMPLKNKE